MKILLTRFSVAVATAAFVLSCACAKQASKAPDVTAAAVPGGDLPPEMVVASFGDQKITAGQLDAKAGARLKELEKQKYEIRRQTLDQLIAEALVEAEAKKEGKTADAWRQALEADAGSATDDEIAKLFEQAKAGGGLPPDAKLEDWKERVATVVTQRKRQEAVFKKIGELRTASSVQVTLPEPVEPRKEVEAKGPSRGPADAKVTIVEFSDFECPFCSRAHDTVEEVMKAYAGKVRLVFRHFPLDFHQHASKAAEASMCANEQGRFWEYHDVLFKNQQKLEVAQLKEHATGMGLDAAKFNECLDSGKFAQVVKDDLAAGQQVGVNGTPAFFINGVHLSGALPLDEFKKVIDRELAAK